MASSCAMVVGSAGSPSLGELLGLDRTRLQRRVAGLDGQGELGIGAGIFVAAIELRLRRQRHQLLQRAPHHRGVAFEQLAAADREQRVADKDDAVVGEVVADMPARVAGRLDHERVGVADLDAVALAHLDVDLRNAAGLLGRADDDAAGRSFLSLLLPAVWSPW